MRLPYTLNIQTGRKLNDKSKEEIMKEVVKIFDGLPIVAVQIAYEVVRVTFKGEDGFKAAMTNSGIRLFRLWCPILGGGPPVTIIHVFDYPFEEEDEALKEVFSSFGGVKKVKKQTYLSNQEIYNGTRLVSVVLKETPPVSPQLVDIFVVFGTGGSLLCVTCVLFKTTSLLTVPTGTNVAAVGSPGTLPVSVRPHGATLLLPLLFPQPP